MTRPICIQCNSNQCKNNGISKKGIAKYKKYCSSCEKKYTIKQVVKLLIEN